METRWRDSVVACVLIGVLLGASAIANTARNEIIVAPAGMPIAQQERLEKLASASLFGQFRSSMADFLWLKVDKYLHRGVDMRGLTPQEKRRRAQIAMGHARGESGHRTHDGETTVVPAKEQDWRGKLGQVEREIKPYQDMRAHGHRDPKEALPLFRLMTWSNPRFVPGYVTGAAMIARDHTKLEEALRFLREGERNNPESIEIATAIGELCTSKLHDYAQGRPALEKALALAARKDAAALSEDEKEAYENAFRWLVLNRREAGDHATARAVALAGLKVFPGDVTCTRYLRDQRSIPSPGGEQ